MTDAGDFAALFQALPDALLVLGTQGEVLAANPESCRLLGDVLENLLGLQFGTPTPSSDPVELQLHIGGRTRLVEMRTAPLFWRGRFATVATLREIDERFQRVADAAPAMLWIADTAGSCTFMSRGWYDYTGQVDGQPLGLGWLNAVHPAERDAARTSFFDAAAERRTYACDYRIRRRDGSYGWALVAGRPRFGVDGSYLGYVGSVIDVTDRKAAERALQQEAKRKDEFLAMLAHELRNPLAPIRSGLQLLQFDADGAEDRREALQIMDAQLTHLVRLVDDLLDVSRIALGKIQLRHDRVDLREATRRACEIAQGEIGRRGQTLETTLPDGPVWIDGDAVRLTQTVENLVSNASKYNAAGGWIRLSLDTDERFASLRVRDSGVGMEPELIPMIFDLFTQSKRTLDRSQGGLGVGLSLVKRIVNLHGGTVEARSDGVDRGSEFTIRLPIAHSQERPAPPIAMPERFSARRILVVDDNRGAAYLVAKLLAKLGPHQIDFAFDGPSAESQIRELVPDLVLLDIGLPGIDGYEVAERIRREPSLESVRIVALTGYGQDKDRARTLAAGMDLHLVKPISLDDLRRTLADLSPVR